VPRIPDCLRRRPNEELEQRFKMLEEFEDVTNWKRSQKGNLWRVYDGQTLTIFRRRDRLFGWSIAGDDEVTFSPHGFGSEGQAMSALSDVVMLEWQCLGKTGASNG